MDDKQEKQERKKQLGKMIDVLVSVLVVPVIVISIISSCLMYSAKQHNQVPSIFGYSALEILTDSMHDEESDLFAPKSFVLVKAVAPSQLRASTNQELKDGDIIAFYEYYEDGYPVLNEEEEQLYGPHSANTTTTITAFLGAGNSSQSIAAEAGSRVIFHRIVEILTPERVQGDHYWFKTQGDNSAVADSFIRDDFVVGVYQSSVVAYAVANVFRFCSSGLGICLLVVIPSGVMLYLLLLSILKQSKQISLEKEQERLATQTHLKRATASLGSLADVDNATYNDTEQADNLGQKVLPERPNRQTPPKRPDRPM